MAEKVTQRDKLGSKDKRGLTGQRSGLVMEFQSSQTDRRNAWRLVLETLLSSETLAHFLITFLLQAYGWCPDGMKCSQSHNIDQIINEDEIFKERRRKKRKQKGKRRKNLEELPKEPELNSPDKDGEVAWNKEDGPPLKQSCPGSAVTPSVDCTEPLSSNEENSMDVERELGSDSAAEAKMDEEHNEGSTLLPPKDGQEERAAGTEERGPKEQLQNVSAKPCLPNCSEGGIHRAGFDAFMTGYIMAYVHMLKNDEHRDSSGGTWLPDCHNKLYLSGKSVPLHIVKSLFSKSSKAHSQKMKLAWAST